LGVYEVDGGCLSLGRVRPSKENYNREEGTKMSWPHEEYEKCVRKDSLTSQGTKRAERGKRRYAYQSRWEDTGKEAGEVTNKSQTSFVNLKQETCIQAFKPNPPENQGDAKRWGDEDLYLEESDWRGTSAEKKIPADGNRCRIIVLVKEKRGLLVSYYLRDAAKKKPDSRRGGIQREKRGGNPATRLFFRKKNKNRRRRPIREEIRSPSYC